MKKLLAFLILVTMLGCGKEAEQEKIEEKKDTVSNIELEKEKVEVKQEEKYLNTKKELEAMLVVSLAGRAAEELVFDTVTTGAANDIEQATRIARAMVTQYGMSDRVGMIQYGSDEDEVFIGRDLAHTKSYGNEIADVIDEEVKRIVDECYTKAKNIILEHEDVLHSCAKLLLEKEKINRQEFEALFDKQNPTPVEA